jgi:hypothetical protein
MFIPSIKIINEISQLNHTPPLKHYFGTCLAIMPVKRISGDKNKEIAQEEVSGDA